MSSKKGKKSEKQNKTPEVIQIEERPTEREIVPGKGLFENDWAQIVKKEDDLLFICGLIEEVYEKSYSVLLHRATEKETYGYSVQWAKELLVDRIMCYFIEHDNGNTRIECLPNDVDKRSFNGAYELQDTEPIPPVIDSWAKGVVPMDDLKNSSTISIHDESPPNESVETLTDTNRNNYHHEEHFDSPNTCMEPSPIKLKSKNYSKHSKQNIEMKVISPPMLLEERTSLLDQKNDESSVSATSHTPFSSTALINVPPLISDPQFTSRSQSKVVNDKYNRIIRTARLDSKTFPSPSIKPIVQLQNSCVSQQVGRSQIVKSHMPKSTTGRVPYPKQQSVNRTLKPNRGDRKHHQVRNEEVFAVLGGMNRIDNNRIPKEPTLPSFLDIIDPLPGVTVYENGQQVTGHVSPRNKLWSPASKLHPITPIVKKAISGKVAPGRIKQSDSLELLIPSSLVQTSTLNS